MPVDRAFGKAYGDATKAFDVHCSLSGKQTVSTTACSCSDVKNDAPGGKYLLDVVATTVPATKITKSDQVRSSCASKLNEYMVDGPDYIALDGRSASSRSRPWTKTATSPVLRHRRKTW